MEGEQYSRYKIWQPLLLGLVAVLGFWAGIKVKLIQPSSEKQSEIRKLDQNHAQKIQDVISYIQSKYVDSLNQQQLIESALKSYIHSLDPYSEYISPEDFQSDQNALFGKQWNFGTELYFIDSNLVFFNTRTDSKAYRDGIRNGDLVTEINGLKVNEDREKIYKLLQQMMDSNLDSIRIKVLHRLSEKLQIHFWKAESETWSSVKRAHLLDENILYVKIDQFIKGSYRDFMELMEEYVAEKKAKHLIIDLRNNNGGLVNEVAYILNQLIYEKEKLLFKTNGFHVKEKEYKSTGNAFFKVDRIVVLMDSCTASAAELFALALKDMNRAKIIGDTSYGKSTILEQFKLSDGSAIRLAIARFTSKSGKNIQRPFEQKEWYMGDPEMDAAIKQEDLENKENSNKHIYGVLPDIPYELQNPILNNKEMLEYIDKKILDNFKLYHSIIQDNPDRIYEKKEIKEQILKEYQFCPENLKNGISQNQFEEEFCYALCAWLFNTELEQRDRLRKDEMIRIAIREIKAKKL